MKTKEKIKRYIDFLDVKNKHSFCMGTDAVTMVTKPHQFIVQFDTLEEVRRFSLSLDMVQEHAKLMDEQEKNTSIAFLTWISNAGWVRSSDNSNSDYWWHNPSHPEVYLKNDALYENFYALFIEHQNKQSTK